MLGRKHVLPSVPGLLHEIQVEGTFADGCVLLRLGCPLELRTEYGGCVGSVFLVTVHHPVCTESGSLEAALYGSFLPIPPEDIFPVHDQSEYARENLPGAIIAKKERIALNVGRERVKLLVTNNGDRPIQVRLRSSDSFCQMTYSGCIRLGRTTPSSRRTLRSPSTAPRPTGSASTSQPAPPCASSRATARPSPSALSPAIRLYPGATASRLALSSRPGWRASSKRWFRKASGI